MKKEEEVVKPTYEFAEVPEGSIDPIEPIKKQIAKKMLTTDLFTVFDVLTYIGKMKKAVDDKQAEIDGMNAMIKAYEDELTLIEDKLGVQKLEDEYQKSVAEAQIESPYAEEDVQGDTGSAA